MDFDYKHPVKNLPDAYRKSTDSNNYKILQTGKVMFDTLETVIKQVDRTVNINDTDIYAETETRNIVMDEIQGGVLNLRRKILNDTQYIIALRAKRMYNTTRGTHADLTAALAYILQCDTEDIRITESDTPFRVKVLNVPLESVFKAGYDETAFIELITKLLPVCVTVDETEFYGTLEFSADESDMKTDGDTKGFEYGYFGLYEKEG